MSKETFFDVRVRFGTSYDTVKVQAVSAQEAKQKVPDGSRVLSVKPSKKSIFGKSLSKEDRITFLIRLSMMTKSRVGVAKSLDIMSRKFKGKIGEVSGKLRHRIDSGDDLVKAMRSMPEHFPETTTSLVESGSHNGGISKGLQQAADFESEMMSIGDEFKKGMAGSIFEYLIGTALLIASAFFVGPWMADISNTQPGDYETFDMAILVSKISSVIFLVILALAMGLLFVSTFLKPVFPAFSDKIISRVPVFKEISLSKTYYAVFFGMATLSASGIRLKHVFDLTKPIAPKGALQNDLANASAVIDKGESWADGMESLDETEKACLDVSQSQKEISEAFMGIAVAHKNQYAQKMKWASNLVDTFGGLSISLGTIALFLITTVPTATIFAEM